MAKNALNELKFGPGMYFYEYHQIPEDFGKFSKLVVLWPKNGHLARFSRRDFETFFSTEIVSGPSKMLRFGWRSVYLLQILDKMGQKWPKITISATLKVHKVAKIQNHPKPIPTFVKYIIWNKYTDFQPNRSIFEGPDTISFEKKVSKSRREKRAKWWFFGWKSANF